MSWKLSASPVARNPFTFAPFAHFRISIRFLLFFFFVSTRMKGEAETRASCRCFRLVSGCSILKKFWNASSRNYARIFLPTFQSPWFLTPIRIVFRGISRGCVWFYPIGSDSSIIDEFIPSPPSLVGDGIHTAVKSMESQSKRVSKVRTKRRKFRKRRTQWFVQDRVKYVLSSFLLDVFSFY